MKGYTPPRREKQRGIFQKRGDNNYELTLTINVKTLAKLDPIIIPCIQTDLERGSSWY